MKWFNPIFRSTQIALLLAIAAVTPLHAAEPEQKPEIIVCSAKDNPVFALRKSITVLNIAIDNHLDAVDMPTLGGAAAQYLQQALQGSGAMRVKDGSGYYLAESSINLLGQQEAGPEAQLATLSRELNSQFIVTGHIRDIAPPPANKGFLSLQEESRRFSLEITVYDGYLGSVVFQKKFHTEASGQVSMHGLQPLQAPFLATEYGAAVGKLLKEAATRVEQELSCIPLMAEISDIRGLNLHIGIGHDAGLRPGDRMRVFQLRSMGVDRQGRERLEEEYLGYAKITRIHPQAAVMEMEDSALTQQLRPGDLVRSW